MVRTSRALDLHLVYLPRHTCYPTVTFPSGLSWTPQRKQKAGEICSSSKQAGGASGSVSEILILHLPEPVGVGRVMHKPNAEIYLSPENVLLLAEKYPMSDAMPCLREKKGSGIPEESRGK